MKRRALLTGAAAASLGAASLGVASLGFAGRAHGQANPATLIRGAHLLTMAR